MKKIILYYSLLIAVIVLFAIIGNVRFRFLISMEFSQGLHVTLESLITLITFFIFWKSKNLYSKTKDQRFLIIGYGFLAGMLFDIIHIFTATAFPYDNLYIKNIEKNPALVYLLFCNLILPLTVYFSIICKPHIIGIKENLKSKGIIYVSTIIMLGLLPVLIFNFIPQLLEQSYIMIHTLEYMNYALYLMTLSIIVNSKLYANKSPINMLTGGLLVLGLGGLFYINPLLIPTDSILAHSTQIFGLLLILLGVSELPELSSSLRIKDDLVSYLSILLIISYVVFVSILTSSLKIITPQYAGYGFVIVLSIFQCLIYVFSAISWKKVIAMYLSAERARIMVRVLESMRRISNANIIKNTVIDEIQNYFHPTKCFIAIYNQETNSFNYDRFSEFLPSKTLENFENTEKEILEFEKFKNTFEHIGISFSHVEEYIDRCTLNGTPQENLLKDNNIKSIYSIPISYKDKLLGYLVLQYKYEYKDISEEELEFLNKIAAQIGISINNKS